MKSQTVINQAKDLIAAGKLEIARDLLLREGYVNQLDPVIQTAFVELFPKSPELVMEEKTTFQQLFSPDVQARVAAAKNICRHAFGEYTTKREAWLKDPRTVEVLLRATTDENPKVVADIVNCLRIIAGRFLKDLRMYPVLKSFLGHPNREVQGAAIYGICEFERCPDRWDVLIPFLVSRCPSYFKAAIARSVSGSAAALHRPDLREALLLALKKERVAETRRGLAKALFWVGDQQTGVELEEILRQEQNESTRQELKSAITEIKSRTKP